MDSFALKLDYLGYKKGVEKVDIGRGYEQLSKLLAKLKPSDLMCLSSVALDEVKRDAVAFYEKYFSLHEVQHITLDEFDVFKKNISKDTLEAYRTYYNLLRNASVFDIPVKLVDGHSMIGQLKKSLIILPREFVPEDVGIMVPISHIELGKDLDKLSSCTYVHEIAHTQQESHPGYAESYLNSEVISIFLEKLSALEKDPTGQLLLVSERKRFMYLASLISQLSLDGKLYHLTEKEKMDSMVYIQSGLLAEKLFDMYLQERKPRKKDAYIYDIQDVFDGKQTVEDMLGKRYIKLNQCKDLNLIKRHM